MISVRIAAIDAPELFRPKCSDEKQRAYAAKNFVQNFFENNIAFLHEIESGKYAGRVIARMTNESGKDLGESLVSQNHAVAQNRGQWCDTEKNL